MLAQFPIYMEESVIGSANIEALGLYWRIQCTYKLPDDMRYVGAIKTASIDVPLGLLPSDGHLCVLRVVPKSIQMGDVKVCANREVVCNHGFLVDPSKPFSHLNKLPQAKLRQLNGKNYMIFIDQEQGQPDSDQNR